VKEINERQFIDLLDSGADDIVICASNLAEIPARCRMLARRRRRQVARDPASAYLEAGDLRLDIARHSLLLPDQQRVALTSQQTRLLAMFISMPDMCVAMATLSQHVFDRPVNYVQQRLSALFYSLNQRLQQYAYAPQIVSVRQQGYRLILPSPDAQPPR
ncbi:MAG: hypothetical protein HGA65_19935, partial [Oscillochloris sp.]|nr:hypothetical protein [Oscillochloris sp.]